jgi:hypothetical protein
MCHEEPLDILDAARSESVFAARKSRLMKKQNTSTRAHLVRGVFYLLLLLALFVITFLGGHIPVTTTVRSRD